jgi:serine/threonine protein kinase/tetratricopeptide (TPR) repeat protein
MPSPQNREEVLLAAALEMPADKRPALLEAICVGDPALRQHLAALLAAHQKADELPPSDVPTVTASVKLNLAATEGQVVGQTIGRYKVLEKVGEGGCGVVYVAEQTEPVRRRVALKVIKLGMDTKQVVARFEAERQALAMMDHPNIAKVLDAGATENGRPYFVMELVRGIKITDYCDQNKLTTKERLDLFIKVCQAIQHAHQKGIIHRDIKPSNILVTLHDGVPAPKVIDFGIAKATEGRLTNATVYTQLQQFIGTPAYMSPEQAEMTGMDIDTRADIYSLGVLLYELLAGRTPFDASELISLGLDAMRQTIREKEPMRPSTRLAALKAEELTTTAKRRSADISKLLHQLKGDLDWIVMKCLEKDRTRRYETASGLAADLKRHLSNEPVLACPPSWLYNFQKTVRRHKFGFAAAATIVTALAVGVLVSTREAARASREARRAMAAEADAKQRLSESEASMARALAAEQQATANAAAERAAREESEAISKFMTEVFRSPDPTRDGRTITVAETLDRAAKKLESDLANHPDRRAKLQATLGATYNALGLARQAIPLQEKARDYYLKNLGLEHTNTLSAMHSLAISYDDAGRRNESLKLREEVLALSRKVKGPEHSDTLLAMNNLANSYEGVGRQDEALKLLEEVLALSRKVNGPEHPDALAAMNNLALSYALAGRRDEALKMREEVLALRRKVSGPEHPDTIKAMHNLANSYGEAGRRDESLKLREEVLALRRKVLGLEHPDTIKAMQNLAFSYQEAGRWEEARKMSEEVLTLRRKVLGPEHPDTIQYLNDIAWLLATSETAEVRNGTNAVQFAEEAVAATHRSNAGFLDTLAAAYAETQQFEKAVAVQREAMSLAKSEEETKDLGSRLILYQANKPYRDKQKP